MDPICCFVCCVLLMMVVVFVAMAGAPSVSWGHRGWNRRSGSQKPSEQVLQSFGLLNQLRAQGLTCPNGQHFPPNSVPLRFDCELFWAAQAHSEDMAQHGYFDHVSPDGLSPQDRVSGLTVIGENIAMGQNTAQGVLEAWKKSNDHCTNMMNPASKLIGMGYASVLLVLSKNPGAHYWTQMFADGASANEMCYPSRMPQFGRSVAPAGGIRDEPGQVGSTWNEQDSINHKYAFMVTGT